MRINNVLALIFSTLLFVGCKSYNVTMSYPEEKPISPKLLTLDKRIEDISNATVEVTDHELKIFHTEIDQNLIDPYGKKVGYISYSRTILTEKHRSYLGVVNIPLMFTPMLLGMPGSWPKYKIEVELKILNKGGDLIGKYSSIGSGNAPIAMYYGYGDMFAGPGDRGTDAAKKAFNDAVSDALNKIRPKIQADVESLNQKLKEAL